MITIELEANVAPGIDRAECTVNGGHFTATSRAGAIHAICRWLRDAGIPDQPWEVPGRIKGSSIYWMADRTISEKDDGMHIQRWKPPPIRRGEAQ